MSSIADSSFLSPLPTQEPSDIESRKSRKRTALATWDHTRLPCNSEPEYKGKDRMFYCKYCENPSYGCQSSSSFRNHLSKKHDIDIQPESRQIEASSLLKLQDLYDKAAHSNQTQELDTQILKRVLNKKVINEALVSLVVVRSLPFRLVEWPEFHALCKAFNPQADREIISSHSELSKKIQISWLTHKDIMRKKLQSALSTIHLSLDIWTSPNKILFLGICSHFVECEREKLSKALLGLRPVTSHSAESQFDALLPVLRDYGITRNLGSIIGDNHPANDKLCRTISTFLLEEEKIHWDPIHHRIRCIGHIINLAVQSFLFPDSIEEIDGDSDEEEEEEIKTTRKATYRKMGPHGKLHNIVVHIHGSEARTREFKSLAERTIPRDNSTRWNSWYQMLKVAIEKAAATDSYTKRFYEALQDDFLTPQDWETLRMISNFLHPFYRATLETEGDCATIDRVLFTMDILIKHYENSLVSCIIFKLLKFRSNLMQHLFESDSYL
jgi:hypothetical protein